MTKKERKQLKALTKAVESLLENAPVWMARPDARFRRLQKAVKAMKKAGLRGSARLEP
jgi:hypothetical protein